MRNETKKLVPNVAENQKKDSRGAIENREGEKMFV